MKKQLIEYLKKSKDIVSDDLFGDSSDDKNEYNLKDSLYDSIIDDYTLELIESGVIE